MSVIVKIIPVVRRLWIIIKIVDGFVTVSSFQRQSDSYLFHQTSMIILPVFSDENPNFFSTILITPNE